MRSTIAEEPDRLQITIPAKRYWFLVFSLGLWLGGHTVGYINGFRRVGLGYITDLDIQGLLVVLGLDLFVLYGLYLWFWNMGGKELIIITSEAFFVRREIYGIGITKKFDLNKISDLRPATRDFTLISWKWGMGECIHFSHGSKTYGFGKGLEQAEVHYLIQTITKRYDFKRI